MDRLLALSIDLDALELYLGLYGLDARELSDAGRAAIPARAAERFGELCAALGVKGTVFAVGKDLAQERGRRELRALFDAGHEIASHSFAHDYGLSRLSPERIDADLARAEEAIAAVTGVRPVGFRAPGYTLSRRLLEILRARGYAYDSSLLPSPPYYLAKAAVIGGLALVGKESRSILGDVRQLFQPREAHLERGLAELPVSVLPLLRVPYLGTLLATAPAAVSRALGRRLANDRLVVIELHGVDLCDATDGVPASLAARQRDLRVPVATKRARLEASLRALLGGRRPMTLAEAARLCATPAGG